MTGKSGQIALLSSMKRMGVSTVAGLATFFVANITKTKI